MQEKDTARMNVDELEQRIEQAPGREILGLLPGFSKVVVTHTEDDSWTARLYKENRLSADGERTASTLGELIVLVRSSDRVDLLGILIPHPRGAGGKNANLIQFRAGKALLYDLVDRTNETDVTASQVAERDLTRWYAAARKSIRGLFSEAEVMAMLEVTAGWRPQPQESDELDSKVAAAIQLRRIDQKWQIDGGALLYRLTSMPAVARLVVLDALEQLWSINGGHVQPLAFSQKIRESGLVPVPEAGDDEQKRTRSPETTGA